MQYRNIKEGVFIERPNRFIGIVEIDGKREKVHIKNTGRCKELLVPGNEVYLEHVPAPERKTAYDLVAVKRQDGRHVNMDSMAPNRMAREWLEDGGIGTITDLRAETVVEDSRYDFSCFSNGAPTLIEVKGCTLERDSVAYFPDAPTERGTKHVRGLIRHRNRGTRCIVLIVIQMKGVCCFRPNDITDPVFAQALRDAKESGVEVIALDCNAGPGYAMISQRIPVEL